VKHQTLSVEQFRALTGRGKPPKHKDVLAPTTRNYSGPVDETIELPLPPKALHPNARPHWRTKAKASKRAREDAAMAARAAGLDRLPARATVQATFYLRRRQDSDNLNSWLKASLDGVFPDDSGVTLLAPSVILVGKDDKPRVLLRVQSAPSKQPPII
jgi:hypothetical protein